ncbi:unnamed protein product [Phyllotreta striolata]|uniref:GCS light chain n=1 Tax=Phyllotreta striolata TaxID=444603 RepID=A0A9N9TSM9_PHYSR|nr:unnamed protein product [Phyllotreta striolata]
MDKFKSLEGLDKFLISTGNILSISDITKKSNVNTSEELVDAIEFTLREFQSNGILENQSDNILVISRHNDNLKIDEHELSELKIGFKVFLNEDDPDSLMEAIQKALMVLKVDSIHDVIVTFKHNTTGKQNIDLSHVQNTWVVLENLIKKGQIRQIGIADIEESTFRALHGWAKVKPSIIQINLSTCCVVPPTLQSFCKENDIKLLTHSDPNDILPAGSIESIFGAPLNLKWALRFLVHVKCRGVLTTKGYLLNLCKNEESV